MSVKIKVFVLKFNKEQEYICLAVVRKIYLSL